MEKRCPGARLLRQPKPELFKCPSCGSDVEIWSDEFKTVCRKCRHPVYRSQEMSCLEWCAMAEDCVGTKTYSSYMKNLEIGIKKILLTELETFFGKDWMRIQHAKKVLKYAEEILKKESGDWHVVIPASILHDLGIRTAEEKYGSSAGRLQEKEDSDIAKKILFRAGLRMQAINEICEIIARHHSPGVIDTQNFKVFYDADTLVNLEEMVKGKNTEETREIIERTFLTATGKEIAAVVYLVAGSKK